jgi:hypothetical protein
MSAYLSPNDENILHGPRKVQVARHNFFQRRAFWQIAEDVKDFKSGLSSATRNNLAELQELPFSGQ